MFTYNSNSHRILIFIMLPYVYSLNDYKINNNHITMVIIFIHYSAKINVYGETGMYTTYARCLFTFGSCTIIYTYTAQLVNIVVRFFVFPSFPQHPSMSVYGCIHCMKDREETRQEQLMYDVYSFCWYLIASGSPYKAERCCTRIATS